MKTGAVITAAGKTSSINCFKPMMDLGHTTIIKRIITTMQQAGVDPIVVVTGNQAELLERHISHMGVICIKNERYEETQMLDSAKLGLMFIQDKCDRFFFTPVDVMLFTVNTLEKLMECSNSVVCPMYKNVQGHPILISSNLIPDISAFDGIDGVRGAILNCKAPITNLQVEDEGILYNAEADKGKLLERHNQQMLHAEIQMKVSKETVFFGPGIAQLLKLIESTSSIRSACEMMHMSYSKGWKMINLAEQQLGYPILIRHAGGLNGGNSELTYEGRIFLNKYLNFEEECKLSVQQLFYQYFI